MNSEELQAQHDEIWRLIYERQRHPPESNKAKTLTLSSESDHESQDEEMSLKVKNHEP